MLVVTGNGGRRPYTIKFYDNALVNHNRLALIVDCKSAISNLLFFVNRDSSFCRCDIPTFQPVQYYNSKRKE
jgi:hypothetical protein